MVSNSEFDHVYGVFNASQTQCENVAQHFLRASRSNYLDNGWTITDCWQDSSAKLETSILREVMFEFSCLSWDGQTRLTRDRDAGRAGRIPGLIMLAMFHEIRPSLPASWLLWHYLPGPCVLEEVHHLLSEGIPFESCSVRPITLIF